jgi:hypothetical protein
MEVVKLNSKFLASSKIIKKGVVGLSSTFCISMCQVDEIGSMWNGGIGGLDVVSFAGSTEK